MHLQVQHRVPHQFHLLLNHFAHSYAFTIASTSENQVQYEVHLLVQVQCPPLFRSWGAPLGAIQVYYQLDPCITKRTSSAFIIDLFTHSCVSTGVLKHSFFKLSLFNLPHFTPICILKSIFNSILRCVSYTLSFAISIPFLGGAVCYLIV